MVRKVPWWLSRWAVVACCGVVLLVVLVFAGGRGGLQAGLGLVDPDLAAVRVYLKANLDSGQWEEIRWWPSRVVPVARSVWSGQRVCRMKFRTEGRVRTVVFSLDNGKATLARNVWGYDLNVRGKPAWYEDNSYMCRWRFCFPNDCDGDE